MATLVDFEGRITQGTVVYGVNWGGSGINPLSIVLTNACDFENDKASYLMVAALVPAAETIQASKEYISRIGEITDNKISNAKWKKVKEWLESYIFNKNVSRYYLISPGQVFESPLLLVDFQCVTSIPISAGMPLDPVAQLPSPYVAQMMVQFASYVARIPVNRELDSSIAARELIAPITIG